MTPERKLGLIAKAQGELIQSVEKLQDMAEQLGISAQVRAQTKAAVLQTLESIRATPQLSVLLVRMRQEKTQYIAAHSLLLAYVNAALATQMEWKSDTTNFKLSLASFLHDIALKNHALAKIKTLDELRSRKNEFNPEDIKLFEQHPQLGSEIARKFEEVPPDVDLIILQHHEKPDGSGFPRSLSAARISPLSALFIVAHDLTQFLLDKDPDIGSEHLLEFIKNYPPVPSGPFKRAIQAVERLSSKKLQL